MRVLDLFSGIGGFSLGLERAGMRTVAFCEIDPFCRAVLAQHWPEVPIHDDVRTLTGDALRARGIAVDVICGGFPCQDLSFAGKRAGLEGARSGLWGEYARLIGELRPRFVVVENVPGLLSLGMGTVLGDLAALGYDATWDCIPAAAVGAPHRRDRVWIVANAASARLVHSENSGAAREDTATGDRDARTGERHVKFERVGSDVADAGRERHEPHGGAGELAGACGSPQGEGRQWQRRGDATDSGGTALADTDGASRASAKLPDTGARREAVATGPKKPRGCSAAFQDTHERGRARELGPASTGKADAAFGPDWWLSEPDVGRVADGVPARVDRLRSLGNAVVPQIPEMIGRAIMASADTMSFA